MEKGSAKTNSDPEDLYQISLLIDQLRHDDQHIRINACKNLKKIGKALGPERTRDELIPFINESIDDEDEVLLAIAENISELVDCVGGVDNVHAILSSIRLLAVVEDSAVRDAAVKSCEVLVKRMPDSHLVDHYSSFVLDLASKDWFTARISATALFHIGYQRLPKTMQQTFRNSYVKLCSDDTPMVRRMAAQNFRNLVSLLSVNEIQEEFMIPFNKLASDDQDSVRIQAVKICITFAENLPIEVKTSQVLPVVIAIGSDRAWRVRWSLACNIYEISRALGDQMTNNTIFECFDNLLRDSEAEVRSAAAKNVSLMCSLLHKDTVLNKVIPSLRLLVGDASEHVRVSMASVTNDLAPILGKNDTVEHLLPMLLELLRDESSDVRLNIISSLDTINDVMGVELLSQSLLPAIVDLAEDTKWRVRFAIIELIPRVAEQLGCDYFNEKLNNLCMVWMGDDVFSIRRAAANNLSKLAELFGEDWAKEHILPRIDRMHTHTNYLQRMTAIYGIQVLVKTVSVETLENIIMPLLLQMVNDAVPNVRLTVARTLKDVISHSGSVLHDSFLQSCILPSLNSLAGDDDRDVRFYSSAALEELNNISRMIE